MFLLRNTKYKKYSKTHDVPAFAIIEALTVLFIFSVITLTFYSVFTLGTGYIIESKNRLGAVSLANEKIEILRNLEYEAVGTIRGVPSGNIPSAEAVTRGSKHYTIATTVLYVNDPFDGFENDPFKNDYKQAEVTISWTGPRGVRSEYSLLARFVPAGIEQALDQGTLSINILDGQGIGVPQSNVRIINDSTDPPVDMMIKTNNTGNFIFYGAPYSIKKYHLVISKDGYETIETINPTTVTYKVADESISVIDEEVNTATIIQDRTADLKFLAKDQAGNVISGMPFYFEGGRVLGHDELQLPFAPVYKIKNTYQTDAAGERKIEDIGPGQFLVSNVAVPTGHTLVGMDNVEKYESLENKYVLRVFPGEEKVINFKIANNAVNSVMVRIADVQDERRLSGARATLSNNSGYSQEMTTAIDGVVFFPLENATVLTNGIYNLKVELDNYQSYNADIEMIDGLVEHQANLTIN